ncbi:uncharacterized protein ASCRUDRAFT_10582 [Ascoidea rubescens DSM 1968]|uniref:Uncharacterized protein n=1 Tax=Ascoidea rubescens DSM 1968 TaxID=1344418 RepID=A0A1D2V982_9ASCO|nr:hypothetical protein ASCRUDRAFT_10582 [Ascoidea rubescens DSM 1968]ODV58119.1 hypothetical protein ASCRUDRAFT_10582 [Ascoidea rubescens DSM 1968]
MSDAYDSILQISLNAFKVLLDTSNSVDKLISKAINDLLKGDKSKDKGNKGFVNDLFWCKENLPTSVNIKKSNNETDQTGDTSSGNENVRDEAIKKYYNTVNYYYDALNSVLQEYNNGKEKDQIKLFEDIFKDFKNFEDIYFNLISYLIYNILDDIIEVYKTFSVDNLDNEDSKDSEKYNTLKKTFDNLKKLKESCNLNNRDNLLVMKAVSERIIEDNRSLVE